MPTSFEYKENVMKRHHHRKSPVKRLRKSGFRARQRTLKGRQTLSRKRRAGRSCNVKKSFT